MAARGQNYRNIPFFQVYGHAGDFFETEVQRSPAPLSAAEAAYIVLTVKNIEGINRYADNNRMNTLPSG